MNPGMKRSAVMVYEGLEKDTLDGILFSLLAGGISKQDFTILCLFLMAMIDQLGGTKQDMAMLELMHSMRGRPGSLRKNLMLTFLYNNLGGLDRIAPDMKSTERIGSRGWQPALPIFKEFAAAEYEMHYEQASSSTSVSNTDVIKTSTSGEGGHGSCL